MEIDLKNITKIHFVGIQGVAMTALAIYAKEAGFKVTGSDTGEIFPTSESLKKTNIRALTDFSPDHILSSSPDLVIYTGAHGGQKNPEVLEAIQRNIPVLPHGKALGLFMNGKRQISVAGSHGKTTTAAMIATILTQAGLDPSYAIGCGEIFGLGHPGHFGNGEWFVAEADEYVTDPTGDPTPRFLWQHPDILVVTNIDYDHPDVYDSLTDIQNAYVRLQQKVPTSGRVILSSDNSNSTILHTGNTSITSVGLQNADFTVSNLRFTEVETIFTLQTASGEKSNVILRVPGTHNAINGAMAIAAATAVGISFHTSCQYLQYFSGTKRRFEKIGEQKGILYYDDYAHHPKEIQATLSGARAWFPNRRIVTVFQPHTYSRTKALINEFANAFTDSDVVILTDIYASAREHETMGVSGEILKQEVSRTHPDVRYASTFIDLKRTIATLIKKGDVIIFMGAGNIYNWGLKLVQSPEAI